MAEPPPPAAAAVAADGTPPPLPKWMQPENNNLLLNEAAVAHLRAVPPAGTTLHFTFGSSVMTDFVKNWLFFARKASLSPLLVGVADQGLNAYCAEAAVPAAAISPELDVWTYARKEKVAQQYEIKTKWK